MNNQKRSHLHECRLLEDKRETFETEAKEIDGYTLTKTPEKATDTFGSTDKTVTYVYKQDEDSKVPIVKDQIAPTDSEENLTVTVEEGPSDKKDNTHNFPNTATPITHSYL